MTPRVWRQITGKGTEPSVRVGGKVGRVHSGQGETVRAVAPE